MGQNVELWGLYRHNYANICTTSVGRLPACRSQKLHPETDKSVANEEIACRIENVEFAGVDPSRHMPDMNASIYDAERYRFADEVHEMLILHIDNEVVNVVPNYSFVSCNLPSALVII